MTQSAVIGAISTSSSTINKKDLSRDVYLRWEAVKNFVIIASAYSPVNYNFNLYTNKRQGDSIYSYLLLSTIVGMPYMYMDFFIKQYTGKVNCTLNPLLKSLNYGTLITSLVHSALHANDLGNAMVFFLSNFTFVQPWAECSKVLAIEPRALSFVEVARLMSRSRQFTLKVYEASDHEMYLALSFQFLLSLRRSYFETSNYAAKSICFGVLAWITIFFISTIPEYLQMKVFYLAFIVKIITVFGLLVYATGSGSKFAYKTLVDIFDFRVVDLDITDSGYPNIYPYGIGLLGVNDYGVISPFTRTANALFMFFVVESVILLAKSFAFHTIKNVVNRCMKFENAYYHSFIFRSVSSFADFFYCQRLILLCFYGNLIFSELAHIVALSSSITKILHSDFKHIKELYLTAIICLIGCTISVTLLLNLLRGLDYALLRGSNVAMLTNGCLKSAIIFYMYGLSKWSTDIHFWLNDVPTRYWRVSWALLPIVLAVMTQGSASSLWSDYSSKKIDINRIVIAYTTYGALMFFVVILGFQTIIKFIASNKLMALFKADVKYGPPEPEDRRRRRKYNEALTERTCTHGCNMLDEKIECNHKEMRFTQLLSEDFTGITGGEASVLQIFENPDHGRKSGRFSEMMDFRMN